WGPFTYTLSVDGAPAGQTTANSLTAARPLSDGSHRWQVLATNPAGQQSHTESTRVFIDTVRPRAKLRLTGARRAGALLRALLSYADHPPAGQPRSHASGVAKVVIRWGDGSTLRLKPGAHSAAHAYRRSGRYRITLLVTDRAGNQARVTLKLSVGK
ncbi:MAG TPA: PKD domain-containing protein, partial [Solirubrobacteraceae bacterium]|nr:PKD domain-containing protein [Solirubrobacteraceae bacterium]